jgi:hypothetical protein
MCLERGPEEESNARGEVFGGVDTSLKARIESDPRE